MCDWVHIVGTVGALSITDVNVPKFPSWDTAALQDNSVSEPGFSFILLVNAIKYITGPMTTSGIKSTSRGTDPVV